MATKNSGSRKFLRRVASLRYQINASHERRIDHSARLNILDT